MAAPTVDLRVLSPSIELDGGVMFENLTTTTTIGELKLKIQDALASHPSPDRMRIIYLGRMMLDSATLESVFGQEAIQQSKVHNLHMVLRDAPSDPAPRVSSAPPNPSRPANTSPNPLLQQATAPVRPQSQPRIPSAAPQPPQLDNQLPNVPALSAVPPPDQMDHFLNLQLNHIMRTQLNQVQGHHAFQQPAPQNGDGYGHQGQTAPAAHHAQNYTPPWAQVHPNGQTHPIGPGGIPSVTHNTIGPNGERVRVTLSGGLTAVPPQQIRSPPGRSPNMLGHLQHPQPHLGPVPRMHIPQLDPYAPFGNPAASQVLMQPQALRMAGQDRASGDRAMGIIRQNLQEASREVDLITNLLAEHVGIPANVEAASLPAQRYHLATIHIGRLNSHLDQIEALTRGLYQNPHWHLNPDLQVLASDNVRMRNATRELIRNLGQHITARRLHAQNADRSQPTGSPVVSAAPGAASETVSGNESVRPVGQVPSLFQPHQAPPEQPSQAPVPPSVYLVSGPHGPHAVVYSPTGRYQATAQAFAPFSQDPWTQNLYYQRLLADLGRAVNRNPDAATSANFGQSNPSANPTSPTNVAPGTNEQPNPAVPAPAAAAPAAANQPAAAAVAQRQPAAAAPAQRGQMVIAAGHIWILVRVFGFIYLFGGSSWRRTIMLGFCGLVFYLVQTGWLSTGWMGQYWDRLRRHFEQLVGIPERPQAANAARPQGQGAANNAANAQNGAAAQPGPVTRNEAAGRGEPSPAEVAQRLIAQREAEARTWAGEIFRTAERVIALFVASLWPGLGERMVAAREEADAQARREQQEREEAERREREESERAAAEANAETEQEAATEGDEGGAETENEVEGKGKERAQDVGEGPSTTTATGVAAENENTPARQREGWRFGDAD